MSYYPPAHRFSTLLVVASLIQWSTQVVAQNGISSAALPLGARTLPGIVQANKAIYLESMEDLEHVSFLSLQNFNLTDESLIQSNWLTVGNVLIHKQHQKVTPATHSPSDLKTQLALMLESFITQLRNGHLRRLTLEEMEAIVQASNLTQPLNELRDSYNELKRPELKRILTEPSQNVSIELETGWLDRCPYLVAIYEHELLFRQRRLSQQTSRNDFEQGGEQVVDSSNSNSSKPSELETVRVDRDRLMRLCQLVVECQSADDMVRLIAIPWQQAAVQAINSAYVPNNKRWTESSVEHFTDDLLHNSSLDEKVRNRPKSLRDSLSLSIAKLCPLILFQLHDEEEICIIRPDDRPPMITVWAFATLFVTIVSFCSLIGLSITPLLGPDVNSVSSTSDSSSARGIDYKNNHKHKASGYFVNIGQQQHKACLTLFEGLAVGSLVGSALFSLIPQAFELQERESNQGFLLKALIIFFGIYLFFLSERIMRIILDTRQRRKRRKRLNNQRSSNSVQLPSMTADYGDDNKFGRAEFSLTSRSYSQTGQQRREQHRASSAQMGRKRGLNSGSLVSSFASQPQKENESWDRVESSAQHNRKKSGRPSTGSTTALPVKRNTQVALKTADKTGLKQSGKTLEAGVSLTSGKRVRRRKTRQQLSQATKRQRRKRLQQLSPLRGTKSGDDLTAQRNSSSSDSSLSLSSTKQEFGTLRGSPNEDSQAYMSNSSHNGQSGGEISDEAELSQMRAVNMQMSQYSKRYDQQHHHHKQPVRTSFQLDENEPFQPNSRSPVEHTAQDISTVAWMIILGDGLHNFIDGISIGAAFSESILSGVSISVAVICEEFPHELGDFAVLVSSGMTVRQALGYNFLSACTCYFGMAIGIILGDVNDGASYISALAAGVFLYIAMVDMMGELSATLEETSRVSITQTLKLLLLQNIGIFIGISIIFVLSFIDF